MITPDFTFLFKVNLALILFYAFFRVFCSKDTFFRSRRFILLASYLVAWIYPFLNFQNWILHQTPMQDAVVYAQSMYTEIQVKGPETSSRFSFLSFQTLRILYFTGMALLGIHFLTQLFFILRFIRSSRKTEINGIPVRLLQKKGKPFLFLPLDIYPS